MAPGVSDEVAKVIEAHWQTLGAEAVSVIVDVDPEVYRLGYGSFEALQQLEIVATQLGKTILHQPGIRIGLVVVDDETLIFTPTPLLIESGSPETARTNAIFLPDLPSNVANAVGLGENGDKERKVGLDPASPRQIQAVKAELESNPPVKFDLARKVRVFNAQFEFVEFELRNCYISRKTVAIPSDLMGLAKDRRTQALLRSAFHLVEKSSDLSEESVIKFKKCIADRFLITLPKYGTVILRSQKPRFELAVKTLRRFVRRFQKRVEDRLQQEIDANRVSLIDALLPSVAENPPKRWKKYLGAQPTREDVRSMLEAELKKVFGSAQDVVRNMEVFVIFKGVTYELLIDSAFTETVRQRIPGLGAHFDEYTAVRES
jgi:hypothetical protein